jgi:PAS domain S-box-containing protein
LQEFVGEIMMHPGEPMECPLIRDRKKDGSYIWVEGTLTNFLKTEGINAIVANFRDVTERKKADEENRFKANLLNTISQAAIATDMNGIVSYWNKAAENIYGWTREEVIGKNIIHLTPSHATREQAFEIMDDLKNGRAWSGEFRVQRKDGTEFPALVTDSPIYDENNKLSGIIGISSDITEKKKLEDLLDKSNRLAKIGNWETDLIKGTVYWSAVTKEIHEAETGYVPDLSQVLNFYKEGKTRDRITQCVQACIEHGTAWDEELQIVTAKGNLKWIKTIGNAEFREGKCIRFYGSFQDIDERKKAELEIKEKAVQLQTLSNNLPDTIMFQFVRELTGVMRFTYISNSVQQLTGKTAEEVMQDPSILYSTIHEDDRQKATEAGEASFRNITPFNEVVHSRNFKGETGWIRVRSVPRKLADGAVIWDGVYTNITEQKKAEILLGQLNETLEKKAVELETSNNELEQFAYVASHDLQEPLRMISGFLQLLEKRIAGQLDETTKQYIGFAVDGAERMKTLIQDLLMYSRIGSNKEDFTIVDLNEVMQYTGRLLEGIIKETGTIITVKSLPVIRANKTLISQLLVNLVSNALKYHGDKKPEIEVGYIEDPGAWIFYVKDNGIGIDSKFFDRVFIIFQRLHNKNEYSGTGIGLAICKKIVEIHKGKIWIESELSKGSTFYFSIPKQTI